MTFKVEIEITPDEDGVHCGERRYVIDGEDVRFCDLFIKRIEITEDNNDDFEKTDRCPACLAAEKAWEESNP